MIAEEIASMASNLLYNTISVAVCIMHSQDRRFKVKKIVSVVLLVAVAAMVVSIAVADDKVKIKSEYYTPYGKVKVKEYRYPYQYYYPYAPYYAPPYGYYPPLTYYYNPYNPSYPPPPPYYPPYPYYGKYKVKVND